MTSGVHHLITGRNGQGKTLYLVSEYLRKLSGATAETTAGGKVDRRLVVGGVRNLLIPHELMEVPELDPESYVDQFAAEERRPEQPPRDDVVCSILNWWLWCLPGDVIVVDEAQRVFRPMAAGRRVPRFIARLETARHYGVQFFYLTQHPELIHKNVRNLVGPHEHVERMLGGSRVMVYQWPGCTHPDRRAKATKRMWKHDKGAFGLYASAELHTKFSERVPWAVYAFGVALIGLAGVLYTLKGRLGDVMAGKVPGAVVSADKPRLNAAVMPALAASATVDARPPIERVSGGYCTPTRCVCYSAAGFRHSLGSDACRAWLNSPPQDYWQLQAPRSEPEPVSSDAERPAAGAAAVRS